MKHWICDACCRHRVSDDSIIEYYCPSCCDGMRLENAQKPLNDIFEGYVDLTKETSPQAPKNANLKPSEKRLIVSGSVSDVQAILERLAWEYPGMTIREYMDEVNMGDTLILR